MGLRHGETVGRYEVVELLGEGGMGEVYRARDRSLRRDVALKVLSSYSAADADLLRRFEQEARAAGAINHANVVAVYDVGTHEGLPYVVSELVEGETLRERLEVGALPPHKVVEIGAGIARGLAAAHARGIVHRDLKPENVLLTREGLAKILDFGIAKLTGPSAMPSLTDSGTRPLTVGEVTTPGIVLGTAGYMSPEQVRGDAVDPRSDLFSLGIILYEMLSGQRAFRRDTAVETMHAILKDEPPELPEVAEGLPAALLRIMRRCLEKQADERFQSARDLAFALEELRGSERASRPRAVAAPTRRGPASPLRWLAVVAGAGALIGLGAFLSRPQPAPPAAPTFQQLTFRRGSVSTGRFGRDGHTVYYTAAWSGQPTELFAVEPGSPESRPLGLQRARLCATSPAELALVLLKGGGVGTLARVPLGSSAPREVLEDVAEADWTADGARVAVSRLEGAKVVLEYPIGKVLYETPAWFGSPRVSPDGTRVAFLDHPVANDSRGDVAVVDAAGQVRRVSTGWQETFGLAWAPGGREVLFTATRSGSAMDLYRVPAAGGEPALLCRVAGRLVLQDVAPDGRVLLTHSVSHWEVLGLRPGEARERDLSWLDHTMVADLSPDGDRLLLGESGEGGGQAYSVYLRRTDGSVPVRLGDGQPTSLSLDGKWVLTIQHGAAPGLVMLPTGPGRPLTLPRGSIAQYRWAWWFPDGRRVLVEGHEEGRQRRLFVQDVPDGLPRPLTPEGTSAPRPNAILPDGSAVTAGCGDGSRSYCLWAVAGGEGRPIPGLEAGEQPIRWADGGHALFVVGGRPGLPARISRLDLRAGRRETWREVGPVDTSGVGAIGDVHITPDGRSHAYHYQRSLGALLIAEGLP